MKYILNKKLKYYTKEILKYFNITIIAFGLIIAIILIKYKPIYKVSISGKDIGYIQNKQALEEQIKFNVGAEKQENIDNITIKQEPEYKLKLVSRKQETNEEEISKAIKENVEITYKYYDIALNNKTVEAVDTIQEAEELVKEIKQSNDKSEELDLSIIEKYTENAEEVNTTKIEIAKTDINEKINQAIEQEKIEKEEQKRNKWYQTCLLTSNRNNNIKIWSKQQHQKLKAYRVRYSNRKRNTNPSRIRRNSNICCKQWFIRKTSKNRPWKQHRNMVCTHKQNIRNRRSTSKCRRHNSRSRFNRKLNWTALTFRNKNKWATR